MQTQATETQPKTETLFETIYRLAKAKDVNSLTKLVKSGACIGVQQDLYSPIMLLAKEGDQASVEFLIDEFKGNRNAATEGYALGGYVRLVDQQITAGANRNFALRGYARSGYVDQANQLLAAGASLFTAVLDYATGGNVEQVNRLIPVGGERDFALFGYALGGHIEQADQQIAAGGRRDYALWGYALCGNIDMVNQLIAAGADRVYAVHGYAQGGYVEQVDKQLEAGADISAAAEGYARGGHAKYVDQLLARGAKKSAALYGYGFGGHIDQVNRLIAKGARPSSAANGYEIGGFLKDELEILRLLAYTDDQALRIAIVENAKRNFFDTDLLLKEAARLNHVINEYQVSFKKAKSLNIKGARAWLLQGPELVRERKLPKEIFLEIASLVTDLPTKDTERLHADVNKQLFKSSMKSIDAQFKDGFFSPKKAKEAKKQTKVHHQKRMTFKLN